MVLIDHRRNNDDGVYRGYSIEDNSGVLIGRIKITTVMMWQFNHLSA